MKLEAGSPRSEGIRVWLLDLAAHKWESCHSIAQVRGLFEAEVKVGPEGEVVIPRPLRRELKIYPRSRIIFRLQKGRLVLEKPVFDAVRILAAMAKKRASVTRLDPHACDDELETGQALRKDPSTLAGWRGLAGNPFGKEMSHEAVL